MFASGEEDLEKESTTFVTWLLMRQHCHTWMATQGIVFCSTMLLAHWIASKIWTERTYVSCELVSLKSTLINTWNLFILSTQRKIQSKLLVNLTIIIMKIFREWNSVYHSITSRSCQLIFKWGGRKPLPSLQEKCDRALRFEENCGDLVEKRWQHLLWRDHAFPFFTLHFCASCCTSNVCQIRICAQKKWRILFVPKL